MGWLTFTVDHEPIPQPRARKGKGNNFYTPRDHAINTFKGMVLKSFLEARPSGWLLDGPFEVGITLWLPRVPRQPNAKKYEPGEACWGDLRVCDVDNVAKAVLDALKLKAWNDDKQVCLLHTKKLIQATGFQSVTVVGIRRLEGIPVGEWE